MHFVKWTLTFLKIKLNAISTYQILIVYNMIFELLGSAIVVMEA